MARFAFFFAHRVLFILLSLVYARNQFFPTLSNSSIVFHMCCTISARNDEFSIVRNHKWHTRRTKFWAPGLFFTLNTLFRHSLQLRSNVS